MLHGHKRCCTVTRHAEWSQGMPHGHQIREMTAAQTNLGWNDRAVVSFYLLLLASVGLESCVLWDVSVWCDRVG
eukprot:359937-Chlamydomonas_euryale.AAC.9